MPNHVTPYSEEILPEGFIYPDSYLRFVDDLAVPDRLIWGFPGEQYGQSARAWEVRLHWQSEGWLYLDEIDPIPFARNGDWAAFFDGNDHSGDPGVVVVDLGNKKNSYKLPNFDVWLAAAKRESGIGEPPYDRIEADPLYSVAADESDGYFFCPNCYEANMPLHVYDTAIICERCGTFFNLK